MGKLPGQAPFTIPPEFIERWFPSDAGGSPPRPIGL
jgi:hypothetical protein